MVELSRSANKNKIKTEFPLNVKCNSTSGDTVTSRILLGALRVYVGACARPRNTRSARAMPSMQSKSYL
jgi:hypothetical protein